MTSPQKTIGAQDVLAFVLELVALGLLAWWGFAVGDGVMAFVLGLGAPLLMAVVWGLFAAPRARFSLPVVAVVVVKLVVFGCAAGALAGIGYPWWALGFAVVAVANTLAVTRFREGAQAS